MDKLTFYRYAALGLLALNLAVLAFFFLYRPLVGGGEFGRPPAIGVLKMDAEQYEAFQDLAGEHQTMMRSINASQKEILASYFGQLSGDTNGQTPEVPASYLALEQDKISGTYAHFLKVEGLLRPEQRATFPGFVEESLQQILGQGRKKPRRPKGK